MHKFDQLLCLFVGDSEEVDKNHIALSLSVEKLSEPWKPLKGENMACFLERYENAEDI